uniref:Uncharacterized protein n=1 Tax=Candidatus Methanogaster sp. ANME-2c ERB4 TaxID=2759911 RepID=A0A7G9YN01_9EURY|nr:hypothetical protein ICHGDBFH_00040 [Methanosarcinales archaeon ANME-2c ERB4]
MDQPCLTLCNDMSIRLFSIAEESDYNVATSLDPLDRFFILLITISIISGSIQNSEGLSLKTINPLHLFHPHMHRHLPHL